MCKIQYFKTHKMSSMSSLYCKKKCSFPFSKMFLPQSLSENPTAPSSHTAKFHVVMCVGGGGGGGGFFSVILVGHCSYFYIFLSFYVLIISINSQNSPFAVYFCLFFSVMSFDYSGFPKLSFEVLVFFDFNLFSFLLT